MGRKTTGNVTEQIRLPWNLVEFVEIVAQMINCDKNEAYYAIVSFYKNAIKDNEMYQEILRKKAWGRSFRLGMKTINDYGLIEIK